MPQWSLGHFIPQGMAIGPQDVTRAQLYIIGVGPQTPVEVSVPDALAQTLTANGQPIPPPIQGVALIDTGASNSAIDVGLVAPLGLTANSAVNVAGVGGVTQQQQYVVKLTFPGTPIPTLPSWFVLDAQIAVQGISVILGRDFLSDKILIYNGGIGMITLSF